MHSIMLFSEHDHEHGHTLLTQLHNLRNAVLKACGQSHEWQRAMQVGAGSIALGNSPVAPCFYIFDLQSGGSTIQDWGVRFLCCRCAP